jgi:hypothetical protein
LIGSKKQFLELAAMPPQMESSQTAALDDRNKSML